MSSDSTIRKFIWIMKILGFEIRRAREDKQSLMSLMRQGSTLSSRDMALSAVYRCVTVISEGVAQLPIEIFKVDARGNKRKYRDHPCYYALREEPNEDMSRFTLFKTLIASTLLRGNGYAYIERDDKGYMRSMRFVPAGLVSIVYIMDQGIEYRRYMVTGFKNLVEPSDMIHILNYSNDGIKGISTLEHARNTMKISHSAESYANGFFENGGAVSGVLTMKEGKRLRDGQRADILDAWKGAFDPITSGPNGIAVLDADMDYKSITINPADAQMLETRQFNVVDICRFFGVSPVKCFDLSNSSYSTVEATQLSFLTDTLTPLLENIELEIKRKVFLPSEKKNIEVKFDVDNLIRADKMSQANFMKSIFYMGGLTPNEIRQKIDLSPVENGDHLFVQSGAQTMEKAISKESTQPGGFVSQQGGKK